MSHLARPITKDEVAAYRHAGVVLLRRIRSLSAVNALRRSQTGLQAISAGQHNISAIMDYVKISGKPLLLDKTENAKGSFLLDTGIAARLREFRQFSLNGAAPEIAAALLDSDRINFFGDQIFVKEPGTRERTAFHQDATYFEIESEKCCVRGFLSIQLRWKAVRSCMSVARTATVSCINLMFLLPRRRCRAPKASFYPTSKDIWKTTTSSTLTWSREISSFITIARSTARVAITAAIRSGAQPLYDIVATTSVFKLAPGRRANSITRHA